MATNITTLTLTPTTTPTPQCLVCQDLSSPSSVPSSESNSNMLVLPRDYLYIAGFGLLIMFFVQIIFYKTLHTKYSKLKKSSRFALYSNSSRIRQA